MSEINSTKVVTGTVRFSYANVFEARAMEEGQEAKYSTAVLIPKSDKKTLALIEKAIEAAKAQGKSLWGGKIPQNIKLAVRDGDEARPDEEAYAGHYFFNCSSKNKPTVIAKDRTTITSGNDFYSGCYGRVSVNFYAFNVKGNRGIGVGLNNILKEKEGEPLGGQTAAIDDFAEFIDPFEDDFLD